MGRGLDLGAGLGREWLVGWYLEVRLGIEGREEGRGESGGPAGIRMRPGAGPGALGGARPGGVA